MPKMSHWNSPELIDVTSEKAAIYAAQGWVTVSGRESRAAAVGVTKGSVGDDTGPAAPAPVKKAAKKSATKKSAAKKS